MAFSWHSLSASKLFLALGLSALHQHGNVRPETRHVSDASFRIFTSYISIFGRSDGQAFMSDGKTPQTCHGMFLSSQVRRVADSYASLQPQAMAEVHVADSIQSIARTMLE